MTPENASLNVIGNNTSSNSVFVDVKELNINGRTLYADGGVISLAGIECFTKLRKLYCMYNVGPTNLDVSNNTALTTLACSNCHLPFVDISKNPLLKTEAYDLSDNIYYLPEDIGVVFDPDTDPNFNGFDPYFASHSVPSFIYASAASTSTNV